MSLLEARLALHLEYHPHVCFYQRGDVSEAFARARRLMTPLGAPYRIGYIYDGKSHDYLPDFVGTLVMEPCSLPKQVGGGKKSGSSACQSGSGTPIGATQRRRVLAGDRQKPL